MNPYYASFYKHLKLLGLADNIVDEIMRCFTVKEYKKQEYFSSINELSNKIGFVISGLFYIYTIQQDGTVFTKGFIKNGQFLLAVFDPEKVSTVNIQSLKDSFIIESKYTDIQRLFCIYHDIEVLSKRRIEYELELICQRMAQYATITAKDRYILFKQEYGTVEKEIPQYIIASYLGITPTQLSRIKAKLRNI